MDTKDYTKKLGAPDIELAGLQIWIHGRQFPADPDFWDGNWLNVTVHCGANGASVWTNGAILRLSELDDWLVALETLNETLSGEANLNTIESAFNVKLKAESLGQITMEVEISPDPLAQQHHFEFGIDQSYLGRVIESCRKALKNFPIVGNRS